MEQTLLHMRIDELERRLARLEQQLGEASHGTAHATDETVGPSEPGEVAGADGGPRGGAPGPVEQPDEGLEGAKLVVLELLSSGYAREEVANYLRCTFGVADAEAVIAGAGVAPG
jgi:hypothetical protein